MFYCPADNGRSETFRASLGLILRPSPDGPLSAAPWPAHCENDSLHLQSNSDIIVSVLFASGGSRMLGFGWTLQSLSCQNGPVDCTELAASPAIVERHRTVMPAFDLHHRPFPLVLREWSWPR